jgi:uncharacterized protein YoxC
MHEDHLHIHFHADEVLTHFLGVFLHKLDQLNHGVTSIMATLDDVVSKVNDLGTVEEGVVTLLTDIKARLDAAIASNDPAKLQQLADALDAQKQRLAEAITANTPAAP